MPLFMDVHRGPGALPLETVVAAHQADLDHQLEHRVRVLRYWYNTAEGLVFRLVEAPNEAAAVQVHAAPGGLAAAEVVEVEEGR